MSRKMGSTCQLPSSTSRVQVGRQNSLQVSRDASTRNVGRRVKVICLDQFPQNGQIIAMWLEQLLTQAATNFPQVIPVGDIFSISKKSFRTRENPLV